MKKMLLLSALILCALTIVGCCCKEKDKDKAADAKVTTFTVGFDADFPPYGFKDTETGEYVGFDLDLAQEVCNRLGWTLIKKPINWDAKDAELNSGAIDCIWNGFTINGREDQYTWTKPYVDNSQVILVKADSPIQTLADLAGKIVAAQTDTPVLKALQPDGDCQELGKTFKQIIVTPTYNNAVMELETGAVDAVALDIGVAKDKLAKEAGKFRMLDEIILKEQYGVGFKLGNEELKTNVEAILMDMALDGKAAEISKKWFDGQNVFILK